MSGTRLQPRSVYIVRFYDVTDDSYYPSTPIALDSSFYRKSDAIKCATRIYLSNFDYMIAQVWRVNFSDCKFEHDARFTLVWYFDGTPHDFIW